MRTMLLAALGMALTIPAVAAAQQDYGAPYPVPGQAMSDGPVIGRAPATPPRPRQPGADRWGSPVEGRWWGGANAPGGWAGYRRPYRGYALPPYWNAGRFAIDDWSSYRLPPPPRGYRWSRYYDDAVLIDRNGSVRDSVPGIDWAGSVPQVRADDDRAYAAIDDRPGDWRRAPDPRMDRDVPPPPVARDDYGAPDRTPYPDGGYGAPYYGDGYGVPYYGDGQGDQPPPPHYLPPASRYVSPDGATIVTTSVGDGGYYGAGSTVVTVQTAPVRTTTTTTTTYVDTVRTVSRGRRHVRGSGTKIIRR